MECSKCQCQDGEYKQGISKKNGKPWKAWKCAECGEFNWLPKGDTPTHAPQANNGLTALLEEIKTLLCAINAKLGVEKPKKAKKVSDEPPIEEADEETPF